jgi:8-oxo-dGTP pyrophosphatase MutT (NUDIX family)
VDLPPDDTAFGPGVFVRTLAEEAEEELGIRLDTTAAAPVAVVHDTIAFSVDVIVACPWPGVVDPGAQVFGESRARHGATWEYAQARWLARRDAAEFIRQAPERIVPVMSIVLRWLGWW